MGEDFFNTLMEYDGPGNVRELVKVLERAMTISGEEATLLAKHLPNDIRIKAIQSSMNGTRRHFSNPDKPAAGVSDLPHFKDYKESVLREAEKEYLLELLSYSKGSIKQACKISGLGRTWLYSLLKKHGIGKSGQPHYDHSANSSNWRLGALAGAGELG